MSGVGGATIWKGRTSDHPVRNSFWYCLPASIDDVELLNLERGAHGRTPFSRLSVILATELIVVVLSPLF